jgi:glycosyltransferase involved in cell wall biosynthesis
MRVAHLIGSLEARYGGPSRSVRQLALATAANGHDVEILTSAPAALPDETVGRLRIRTWRRGWPATLCPIPELPRHLRAGTYDIVHHHGLWLRTLHYAHRKSQRDRIPFVLSPRGMMSAWAWRRQRLKKAIAARFIHPGALAGVSGWHATSHEEVEEIRSLGFSQPACVAPNGVDAPTTEELATARTHWEEIVPAATNTRVALFHSRLHPKKRVIELIDLWAALAPAGWTLLIVGIPEQYTVAQLRSYVLRARGTAQIEVFDGSDRPAPYAIASLFLLPSHTENFGLVIAEAMAASVPVVVTDTTPWRQLNAAGLGWCVPWAEFPAATRAAVSEDPAALRQRGSLARDWVLRDFSWARSAADLAAFYATLQGGTQ